MPRPSVPPPSEHAERIRDRREARDQAQRDLDAATEALHAAVLDGIRAGGSERQTVELGGVSRSTVYRLLHGDDTSR
jgi:DNA invertase Pin-like site-specific DNA recombinase